MLPWPTWSEDEWRRKLSKRKDLRFDPDQPRDEQGRWTGGGGATAYVRVPADSEQFNRYAKYGEEGEKWWIVKQGDETYTQFESQSFGKHDMIVSGPRKPESAAIQSYIDNGYQALNQGLRDGTGQPDTHLDRIIARNILTKPTEVYRTIKSSVLTNLKVGDQIQDNAYVSTTWKRSIADRLASPEGLQPGKEREQVPRHVITIDLPKGQNALEVEQWEGRDNAEVSEREFLLPRGMTFEVTKVDAQGRIERMKAVR